MIPVRNSVFFILVIFQIYGSFSETVNVTIADGNIQGQVNTTVRNNVTYTNYRGIPYAEPPLGKLRFTNPVKNSAWNGTWDATYDRSECIQYDGFNLVGGTIYGSEDCLYINVYVPGCNATDLPVLVWIHGGAFIYGNSSYKSFGPDYILEQCIIFVSFNYRLGIFGFLSTEDEACPGNWGIKDQILALKWVQTNIGYFGGNSSNVTIWGESAGAASVHLLMQTNLTKGLYKGAIMHSGTTLNLWALNTRAALITTLTATSLGIVTTSSSARVAALRNETAENLQNFGWVSAWSLYFGDALRGLPFGPTIEPNIDGAVYTNASDDALRAGSFVQVPVFMGINSNEAAAVGDIPFILRFYLLYYDGAVDLLTPYDMTYDSLRRSLAGADIKIEYFNVLPIAASYNNTVNFVSADQFNRPIRRAGLDMANYTNVYFYVFGYEGNVTGIENRNFSGAGHGEMLPYMFRSYNNYTDSDIKVSETIVLLLSNFAKFGDPTPEADSRLNNTIWNTVEPTSTSFSCMTLNESMTECSNPKQADWVYYTGLWSKYGNAPNTTTY